MRHWGEGLAFVSYWEWFKLVGLSLLISTGITATGFAIWWLIR